MGLLTLLDSHGATHRKGYVFPLEQRAATASLSEQLLSTVTTGNVGQSVSTNTQSLSNAQISDASIGGIDVGDS